MPVHWVEAYAREMPKLEAERQRLAIQAASFSNLKKEQQRRILRELDRAERSAAQSSPEKLPKAEYLRALTQMGVEIVHETA